MEKLDFQGFDIENCQLKHEEFVKESQDNATSSAIAAQGGLFKRRGFCAKSFRDKNLACAHSMAWYQWIDELKKYPLWFGSEAVQSQLLEMDKVRTQIFVLDHQKGDLEKKKVLDPSNEDQKYLSIIKEKYEILIHRLQDDFSQLMHHFKEFHQD